MRVNKKAQGMKSIIVFIPTIIAISIFYILIIVSSIFLNKFTTKMSENAEKTNYCINAINDFQQTSDKLSAIAIAFIHNPIDSDTNKLNTKILDTYYEEIALEENSPEELIKRLKDYDLPLSARKGLNIAEDNAQRMIDLQARAITYIGSLSYIDIPDKYFDKIKKSELSADEAAQTDEEKLSVAAEILLSPTYSNYQSYVSKNTRAASNTITEESNAFQTEYTGKLKFARGFMWTTMLLSFVTSAIFFIVLLRKLILPINDFAKKIDADERLNEKAGLYEANYLATAYNNLLDRRDEYDSALKNVAEVDSLTGLPNRYSFNEFLKKPIEEDKSTCLFVLDINNLKTINDTYGHSKGDELIKNASICIRDAFANEDNKNCYRIGGDEFVVILDNIEEKDINEYLKIFLNRQNLLKVSIAYGYSYSNNVKLVGYEKLMMEADELMYKNKNEMKSGNGKALYC